jgi:hypothetical protein
LQLAQKMWGGHCPPLFGVQLKPSAGSARPTASVNIIKEPRGYNETCMPYILSVITVKQGAIAEQDSAPTKM